MGGNEGSVWDSPAVLGHQEEPGLLGVEVHKGRKVGPHVTTDETHYPRVQVTATPPQTTEGSTATKVLRLRA